MLAERRNSPFNGRPPTSRGTVCKQVAARDRADRACDGRRRPQQVIDQRIDGTFHVSPRAVRQTESNAGARFALVTDHLTHVFQLLRDALIRGHDGIERIADLARDTDLVPGQAHREIARQHRVQCIKQFGLIEIGRALCMAVRGSAMNMAVAGRSLGPAVASLGFRASCGRAVASLAATPGDGRIFSHVRSPGRT